MKPEHPSYPPNKKEYISEIGKLLIQEHGKQKYYSPENVVGAAKNTKKSNQQNAELIVWAMAIFCTHDDFDAYFESEDDEYVYTELKAELLEDLLIINEEVSVDFSSLDLDASWLDFGDLFDSFLEGVGAFFGGLFDL